jgi:adenylate cyclase
MIKFLTLGGLDLVRADGGKLRSVLAQPKRIALLAYLAACSDATVRSRDSLLGVFWPDRDQDHARHALNQSLYVLRRALGAHVLQSQGDGVTVTRDHLWCDVYAFNEALEDSRPRDALDLYRGDLLRGFFVSDAPDFERWVETERARLRSLAAGAAWSLAEREAARGDLRDASEWAKQATDLQPHDESAFRRFLTLLDGAGKRPEAIRALERFVARLRNELGLEPAPETVRLGEALRSSRAETRPATAAGGGIVSSAPAMDSGVTGTLLLDRPPASRHRSAKPPGSPGDDPASGSPLEPPAQRAVESIAVLPFMDMSPNADQQYFGDGIAEELISALTTVDGLRVAARTSSFQFKGTTPDVRDIGRRLGVETVLEGSVRKSGDRLRITAQLVSAADGFHIWSETYDRELEDVFAIQDEIAGSISDRVRTALTATHPSSVDQPLIKHHTESLAAYKLYLKGRYSWSRRTAGALRRGIRFFEKAITVDPGYALAYAGLADSYSLLGWYRYIPSQVAFEKTRRAARTALEIDGSLAEAYTSLAYAEFLYAWDWNSAESHFERAIALSPTYPTARHFYAEYLMANGRFEEAHQQMRQGHELDPLALGIATGVGWTLYYLGRYEEAIDEFHNVLALDPHFVILPWFLGPAYVRAGRTDAAITLYESWIERTGHPGLVALLAQALTMAGRHERARGSCRELEQRARTERIPSDYLAVVYASLGEMDEAFAALERAVEERCWTLAFLNVDPSFESLRADPRFEDILNRMVPIQSA